MEKANQEKLVLENQGLAYSMARKYHGAREDLNQEALCGLVEAASKFDPERGVKFSTFAGIYIRKNLCKYIAEQGAVKIPQDNESRKVFFRAAREQRKARAIGGHELSDSALAKKLDVNVEKIKTVRDCLQPTASMDAPSTLEGGLSLHEQIASDLASPEARIEQEELREIHSKFFDCLGETEKQVYFFRIDLDLTLQQVGEIMDLSKQRVGQIHEEIRSKAEKFFRKQEIIAA